MDSPELRTYAPGDKIHAVFSIRWRGKCDTVVVEFHKLYNPFGGAFENRILRVLTGKAGQENMDPAVKRSGTTSHEAYRESLSRQIAVTSCGLGFEDLPRQVVEKAKALALDSLGIALASTAQPFAERALAGLRKIAGAGQATIIGSRHTSDPGTAALMNGLLIHGLDFDDTHLAGVVHTSASVLPAALAAGELEGRSSREVLRAFVVGTEVAARVGLVAAGEFHQRGFHPTGIAGAFGAAIAAGLLLGLEPEDLTTAQGIVGSMSAGLLEFLEEGTWTKRMHPGWAAHAGLTAASLAGAGFTGPSAVYEGRFGLYASHLGRTDLPFGRLTEGLGERWELLEIAVKPYPACHFVHAFIDAALELRRAEKLDADDIERIVCKIAAGEVSVVCEPIVTKRRPQTTYDAQFSVPYTIASAIVRGRRLSLEDFSETAIREPAVLDLAEKVDYEIDPDSGFPEHFSGEVVVHLYDGRTLSWREQVNRGASERPLSGAEIREKFDLNAAARLGPEQAELVAQHVEQLDHLDSVRELLALLRVDADRRRA